MVCKPQTDHGMADNLDSGERLPAVRSVAIIGMGLMGGSLGLALKGRFGAAVTVTGYARRAETRRVAMAMGACDRVLDDPCEAVGTAEVVVLCTPILDMPALVSGIYKSFMPGTIVTDVGSTKAMLMEQMHVLLAGTGARFIGSHPMAGSERTGMEAARTNLYDGAVVIVTPPAGAEHVKEASVVERLWESVGAHVVEMDASQHDAIVAGTSHVPHLMAALLVLAAARTTAEPGLYCGPGFRDSTRIAAGSEFVWHDIVKSNAASIGQCLRGVRENLDVLLGYLDRGDFDAVRELLGTARLTREQILGQGCLTREWERVDADSKRS